MLEPQGQPHAAVQADAPPSDPLHASPAPACLQAEPWTLTRVEQASAVRTCCPAVPMAQGADMASATEPSPWLAGSAPELVSRLWASSAVRCKPWAALLPATLRPKPTLAPSCVAVSNTRFIWFTCARGPSCSGPACQPGSPTDTGMELEAAQLQLLGKSTLSGYILEAALAGRSIFCT